MTDDETLQHRQRSKLRAACLGGFVFCALLAFLLAGLLAGGLTLGGNTTSPAPVNAETPPAQPTTHALTKVVLACPGRIEGMTDVVNVGAAVDGVLLAVRVSEGQRVRAGELIAQMDCRDLEAEVPVARAATESSRQTRERLLRGSRTEERRVARDHQAREEAVLQQASAQYQRMSKLYESGDVSRETFDNARRDLDVAQAARNAAENQLALVNATPLPEELAKAESEIKMAEGRVNALIEKIRKCAVRSPVGGTVLRTHLRAGESFSAAFSPPIVSLADLSRLKVRAEVDERDLGHIFIGQQVMVTVPAFPDRQFRGQVTRLGEQMGRKRVRTGDPAEKSDRDVLEVMVDLVETDQRLVIGLRATVQFLAKSGGEQ